MEDYPATPTWKTTLPPQEQEEGWLGWSTYPSTAETFLDFKQ